MKKSCIFLAALLCFSMAVPAMAIDFKIKGMWNIGFGLADPHLTYNHKDYNGRTEKTKTEDTFAARQRLFLMLEAAASENLSGTFQVLIGPQEYGYAPQGGALGADGVFVKVRQAYIDWAIPSLNVQTRMGIQNFAMPNAAGGSAIFDLRGTAVNVHTDFNENVGLTAMWFRPFNDNYDPDANDGIYRDGSDPAGYLDNMDLFALILPLKFEGFEITPWAMYGMQGRNAGRFDIYQRNQLVDGAPQITMTPYMNGGLNVSNVGTTSKTYGSLFWAGLPFKITAFDPWNIEVDLNYGYVEPMGRYDVIARNDPTDVRRASTKREGWLAKALVEYKMDWGVPGIFGWYGSGDDGNVKNGSERLPSLCPYIYTTSFMGDGNLYWGPAANYLDLNVSNAGTWGVGVQFRDMSFLQDLSHTFRAALWGGTNSPSMVKYMSSAYAWDATTNVFEGPYLTTNDYLLEFNLVNVYQMYENFDINLELGYIANFMDDDTWKKSYRNWGSYEKQDAWKAQLVFTYKF